MFEEIAYERANKKYPIPKVTSEIEISRNYRYGEGFKEGITVIGKPTFTNEENKD